MTYLKEKIKNKLKNILLISIYQRRFFKNSYKISRYPTNSGTFLINRKQYWVVFDVLDLVLGVDCRCELSVSLGKLFLTF